jgi:hypothetical protein
LKDTIVVIRRRKWKNRQYNDQKILIYVFWLPLWYLLVIVLPVLWFTSADYPFGIFWSLYCLFFDFRLLITPLVSFGHCIVCSFIYVFWLPLWYLSNFISLINTFLCVHAIETVNQRTDKTMTKRYQSGNQKT